MGHRHLYYTPQMSEMNHDQIWNHPRPDPRVHFENVAVNGVNLVNYSRVALRSNDHPPSSFSSEIPNYSSSSGTSYDPYLHASSAVSSCRIPPNYAQRGPSCYNRLTIGESNTVNSQMDNRRAQSKRKNSAISMVSDRGNTSGCYNAGSSYNLPISYDHLQPRAMSGPQYQPLDPISMIPNYRNNNLITAGEGSQRNVRSRHSHDAHLEFNAAHSSRNLPRHFHSTGEISGPSMAGQWSHTPVSTASNRGIHFADIGCFNHEMNQSLTGSSVSNGSVDINGSYGYHPNLFQSRNQSAPSPILHCPSTRGMVAGYSSFSQSTTPYISISSYPPMGFATTIEDGNRSGLEVAASSRYSRPLSIIGRSNGRNGRARSSYDRLQSFSHENNGHSRWLPEGVVMADRSAFYDSMDFLDDQHEDMRLDIDHMSYEELLALEERIGDVSTGLSEDMISRSLIETTYCSSDKIQGGRDEVNCSICLEEYKDEEDLGRLKCGHDYHISCIKEWLLVKNVCPICKASALADLSKEKQIVSL